MYFKVEETFIFDPSTEMNDALALEKEFDKHGIEYKKSFTTTSLIYVTGSNNFSKSQLFN